MIKSMLKTNWILNSVSTFALTLMVACGSDRGGENAPGATALPAWNGQGDYISQTVVPMNQSRYGNIRNDYPVQVGGRTLPVGDHSWLEVYNLLGTVASEARCTTSQYANNGNGMQQPGFYGQQPGPIPSNQAATIDYGCFQNNVARNSYNTWRGTQIRFVGSGNGYVGDFAWVVDSLMQSASNLYSSQYATTVMPNNYSYQGTQWMPYNNNQNANYLSVNGNGNNAASFSLRYRSNTGW